MVFTVYGAPRIEMRMVPRPPIVRMPPTPPADRHAVDRCTGVEGQEQTAADRAQTDADHAARRDGAEATRRGDRALDGARDRGQHAASALRAVHAVRATADVGQADRHDAAVGHDRVRDRHDRVQRQTGDAILALADRDGVEVGAAAGRVQRGDADTRVRSLGSRQVRELDADSRPGVEDLRTGLAGDEDRKDT